MPFLDETYGILKDHAEKDAEITHLGDISKDLKDATNIIELLLTSPIVQPYHYYLLHSVNTIYKTSTVLWYICEASLKSNYGDEFNDRIDEVRVVLSTMHDIIEEARLKLVADFNGKLTMVNYDIA